MPEYEYIPIPSGDVAELNPLQKAVFLSNFHLTQKIQDTVAGGLIVFTEDEGGGLIVYDKPNIPPLQQ
jgi:hypothetical protein